jgi:HD-GYP domain-containing protein (c-di-GMP phosphodiesterase class II)
MEADYIEQLVLESEVLTSRQRNTLYVEMNHGVKVSNLARAVANEMGKDTEFCRDIEVAGILHDIGKLWVSKYLVEGTGRETTLSVEKMKYVRMHPNYSKMVLLGKGYPSRICEAVFYHHENVDGTGYPRNLRGDDIPEMARILRICDVFCALTTDRSYRRAFDLKSAMEIMIDEAEDYDMQAFLAFQRVLHSDEFREMDMLATVLTPLQKQHLPLFVREAEIV